MRYLELLARARAGETSPQIARSLGLTRQGVTYHLNRHAREEWQRIQTHRRINDLKTAQNALGEANGQLAKVYARARFNLARLELERLAKRLHGVTDLRRLPEPWRSMLYPPDA